MIIGFTGTRAGMTGTQRRIVGSMLNNLDIVEAHHGDCIGADEQFHELCQDAGVNIVIHPPEDDSRRAFCPGAIRIEPPAPYLERNHNIVDDCEFLIAAPKEMSEPPPARGQGTWSTVRYARTVARDYGIMWPRI